MKMGGQDLDRPLVLSPMVDVTDAAFRSIAREWDADVTCSEMVSAAGLIHGNTTSWRHVQRWPSEAPYGVQLMGSEGDQIAHAIRLVGEQVAPDFIDLNLGCPSPNILRSCAGGFLLRDPAKAGKIMLAAREACDDAGIKEFSVKMRLGHDANTHTYLAVGKAAEDAGANWCTLHARTVVQGYSGEADWRHIGEMVRHLSIPVIGNGDLRDGDQVVKMREETDCAGFFIARAAMNDPTIFRRMKQVMRGDAEIIEPSLADRIETALTYFDRATTLGLDKLPDWKRQATRFLSGAPGAKQLRFKIHGMQSTEEIRDLLRITLAATRIG